MTNFLYIIYYRISYSRWKENIKKLILKLIYLFKFASTFRLSILQDMKSDIKSKINRIAITAPRLFVSLIMSEWFPFYIIYTEMKIASSSLGPQVANIHRAMFSPSSSQITKIKKKKLSWFSLGKLKWLRPDMMIISTVYGVAIKATLVWSFTLNDDELYFYLKSLFFLNAIIFSIAIFVD